MNFGVAVIVAVGLGLDAFAVAIATSVHLGTVTPRQVFRLSFHFGLVHTLMPLAGWLAGTRAADWIGSWDHLAAFGLLALVGARAIHGGLRKADDEPTPRDPTRGVTLLMLSIATSIDALAVGVSFAMLDVDIWYPVLVIGLTASAMTATGMLLGGRLGRLFGKRVEIAGGIILIGIGVKILVEHLTV